MVHLITNKLITLVEKKSSKLIYTIFLDTKVKSKTLSIYF